MSILYILIKTEVENIVKLVRKWGSRLDCGLVIWEQYEEENLHLQNILGGASPP